MGDFFREARGIVSSGAMIPTLETERLEAVPGLGM
jgi:hypothetical protein